MVEDPLTTADTPTRFARVAVLYVSASVSLDVDGDGITGAMEAEVFGTSDSVFDNFATSDIDGDGVPAMIEYAFNLDPKVAGPPLRVEPGAGSMLGLPAVYLVAAGEGQYRLRIEYLRRVGSMLTYAPQFSSTLNAGDWTPLVTPVSVADLGNGWERCIVEDLQTTSGAASRFGRVAVSW